MDHSRFQSQPATVSESRKTAAASDGETAVPERQVPQVSIMAPLPQPSMPLAPKVPSWLTGVGIIVGMQVGPNSTNWAATQLTESISTVSNSCPTSKGWPQGCSGSGNFSVGVGGTATDGESMPGTTNVFWDQHALTSNVSLLNYSGIQTCQIVCSQTYYCAGNPVGGGFVITYNLNRGTVSGQAVTNVSVTKQ